MARSRGRRTDYAWNGGTVLLNNITTSTLIASMVVVNQSSTLMRVHGEIMFRLATSAAALGSKILGCGLIAASDDQFAAGASAFPNPITDMDAAWLWHGFGLVGAVSTTLASNFSDAMVARLTIDSKAMRKVRANQQIILVVDPEDLVGTETVDGMAAARFLFGS